MIAFIRGKLIYKTNEYIILETNGVGYRIYLACSNHMLLNQEYAIYTYQHIREDANLLFGFQSLQEHDLFIQLISVKGVGPKTALHMLAASSYNDMINAIEQNDINYMKKLPGIGAKTASQIVLDLKGKLICDETTSLASSKPILEAMEALQSLGYKSSELKGVQKELEKLNDVKEVDEYIKEALMIIAKQKGV